MILDLRRETSRKNGLARCPSLAPYIYITHKHTPYTVYLPSYTYLPISILMLRTKIHYVKSMMCYNNNNSLLHIENDNIGNINVLL